MERLKDESDLRGSELIQIGRSMGKGLLLEKDRAGIGLIQGAEDVQQGRLATSAGTGDGGIFASMDRQADIHQSLDVPVGIGLVEVLTTDQDRWAGRSRIKVGHLGFRRRGERNMTSRVADDSQGDALHGRVVIVMLGQRLVALPRSRSRNVMWFSTIVLKNSIRRPLRSALTIIAIATAIGAVVALVGIASGFERTFLEHYRGAGIDLVVVRAGASQQLNSTLDQSMEEKIQQIPSVKDVIPGLGDVISFEARGFTASSSRAGCPNRRCSS